MSHSSKQDLQSTVEALRQILDVMPDDLVALRALFETYIQLEQPDKALECLYHLDDTSLALQNAEMMEYCYNQYASVADAMPEVRKRMERLEQMQMFSVLSQDTETQAAPAPTLEADIDAEMALGWDLYQEELLSQDEYSILLRDLTDMSSREVGVPVTALHALHDRNFSRFDRLLAHMSQKSGVPIVPMGRFDFDAAMASILPIDFIRKCAAMPFGMIVDDLMIGVLNPFDQKLVQRVQEMSGRRCHPYLVTPQDYDARLALMVEAAGTSVP